VTARAKVVGITPEQVKAVLGRFEGTLEQLPPMYSAVKHQGERLYKLARQGLEVERTPRQVRIYRIALLDFDLPEIEIEVDCSKGTYVRTLAEDIGAALGCGGHVCALRRTGVGPYVEPQVRLYTQDALEAAAEGGLEGLDGLLLPLESALERWPLVRLTADLVFYLRQGQAVQVPKAPTEGWVRLAGPSGEFLGMGEILDDGRVQPKRLL
jgi:tRNA pseudouridine55 synthase